MKKRRSQKSTRVSPKSRKKVTTPLFYSRRVIFITGSLAVLFLAVMVGNRRTVLHAVQGASVVKNLYLEAMIPLPQIPGAVGYNIYYTPESDAVFANSVRGISPQYTAYTIGYLPKGTNYKYKITAIDATGKEFWISPISIMTNLQGM